MRGFLIILIFFLTYSATGQTRVNQAALDSLEELASLSSVDETDPRLKDPTKAALYSAVLPGLGQAYNKKYWKIPIIYGGFAALGYFIWYNNDQYNIYRTLLFAEIDGDPDTVNDSNFSESQLRNITDDFRRNRDILIILTAVLYGLNIVDAHVDAHLKEFQINEALSMSVKPSSFSLPAGSATGISLALRIK